MIKLPVAFIDKSKYNSADDCRSKQAFG